MRGRLPVACGRIGRGRTVRGGPYRAHWSPMSSNPVPKSSVSGFLPALEGMRGFAAVGVLITHVAFQTGAVDDPLVGRIWARLDLAVALFFALSGFLLWRPHAAFARGVGRNPSAVRYFV